MVSMRPRHQIFAVKGPSLSIRVSFPFLSLFSGCINLFFTMLLNKGGTVFVFVCMSVHSVLQHSHCCPSANTYPHQNTDTHLHSENNATILPPAQADPDKSNVMRSQSNDIGLIPPRHHQHVRKVAVPLFIVDLRRSFFFVKTFDFQTASRT